MKGNIQAISKSGPTTASTALSNSVNGESRPLFTLCLCLPRQTSGDGIKGSIFLTDKELFALSEYNLHCSLQTDLQTSAE